ncbi:MAG: NUDIX hydrolase [Kangiellaceae bacterium]
MNKSIISSLLIPLEQKKELNFEQFNDEVKHAIASSPELTNYLKVMDQPLDKTLRPASVLIPLVNLSCNDSKPNWQVILTKRAKHLKHHAGEICFPGGRFEEKDKSLETTAKRETEEEIGLSESEIEIIGRLPKQITISQYYVTPYVGIVTQQEAFDQNKLSIDTNEVDEAFTVPLDFLINTKNHKKIAREIKDVSFSYHVIAYKNYNIWGATARMLVNLSQRLNPKN